jgi:hypothetical protein
MALTNSLKPVVDRKQWEFMTPCPTTSATGMFVIDSNGYDMVNQWKMYVCSATVQYLYVPMEDAWIQLPSGALGGTFGVGATGAWNPNGPSGTASAGTTTTMTTTLTIPISLAGYVIRTTGGTGAGQDLVITSNTTGANAIFTFAAAETLGADTTFVIRSGRFYVWNAGTMSATSYKYYDVATGAWTACSVTTAPATWGIDGTMCAPYGTSFATGTATSGGATTLVNSAKAWTVDQWIGYQIRITNGIGEGQTRVITDSDATSVTVAAWTIQPNATSVYSIEGDENAIYLIGGNAAAASVNMYKYAIAANTWALLSPGTPRAAVAGLGATLTFVDQQTHPAWTNESVIFNGRRLYSFRGGASTAIDYYDIPGNTWVSTITYAPTITTFTAGTGFCYFAGWIYLQKDNTNTWFKYSPSDNILMPFSTLMYAHGAVLTGDKVFSAHYTDGTSLHWVYILRNTGTELHRCLVI